MYHVYTINYADMPKRSSIVVGFTGFSKDFTAIHLRKDCGAKVAQYSRSNLEFHTVFCNDVYCLGLKWMSSNMS